jgi:hypothetical protein
MILFRIDIGMFLLYFLRRGRLIESRWAMDMRDVLTGLVIFQGGGRKLRNSIESCCIQVKFHGAGGGSLKRSFFILFSLSLSLLSLFLLPWPISLFPFLFPLPLFHSISIPLCNCN